MSRQDSPGQELPLEVILSLQRILDLQHGNDADTLDGVSGQFDTVGYLNKLFPTGEVNCRRYVLARINELTSVTLEASLGELEAVQQRLADNERQLKAQIDELTEELKTNQDPNRMQLIQEMISVRFPPDSGFSG